jgi:hypothetical protein
MDTISLGNQIRFGCLLHHSQNSGDNLLLNDDMVFIQDTEDMSYRIGSQEPVPVLSAGLMNSDTGTKFPEVSIMPLQQAFRSDRFYVFIKPLIREKEIMPIITILMMLQPISKLRQSKGIRLPLLVLMKPTLKKLFLCPILYPSL